MPDFLTHPNVTNCGQRENTAVQSNDIILPPQEMGLKLGVHLRVGYTVPYCASEESWKGCQTLMEQVRREKIGVQ